MCVFVDGRAAGSSGDVCDRPSPRPSTATGDTSDSSTPKAISDLAARRARHRLLSGETEKHTSRPLNKVIKSASATTLSLMIPAGKKSCVDGGGSAHLWVYACVFMCMYNIIDFRFAFLPFSVFTPQMFPC